MAVYSLGSTAETSFGHATGTVDRPGWTVRQELLIDLGGQGRGSRTSHSLKGLVASTRCIVMSKVPPSTVPPPQSSTCEVCLRVRERGREESKQQEQQEQDVYRRAVSGYHEVDASLENTIDSSTWTGKPLFLARHARCLGPLLPV